MTLPTFPPTYPTTSNGITTISPNAYTCGRVNQFIVLGCLENDEYSVQWCAIDDPTDWPTPNTDDARSKQSGKQTLSSKYGWVMGIAGNDFYGYVFQERAITKMAYVGGDVVFSFDTFEEERGMRNFGAMAQSDDKVFFESLFGHHVLENDQVIDIGTGKIDRTY